MVFQRASPILHSHQQYIRVSVSPRLYQHTIICNLILVMPVYLMVSHVVLIFISLVVNDVEHLLCAYWPFLHVLWGNVYSDPEPPSFFFIGRGNKDHGKYSKVLQKQNLLWDMMDSGPALLRQIIICDSCRPLTHLKYLHR